MAAGLTVASPSAADEPGSFLLRGGVSGHYCMDVSPPSPPVFVFGAESPEADRRPLFVFGYATAPGAATPAAAEAPSYKTPPAEAPWPDSEKPMHAGPPQKKTPPLFVFGDPLSGTGGTSEPAPEPASGGQFGCTAAADPADAAPAPAPAAAAFNPPARISPKKNRQSGKAKVGDRRPSETFHLSSGFKETSSTPFVPWGGPTLQEAQAVHPSEAEEDHKAFTKAKAPAEEAAPVHQPPATAASRLRRNSQKVLFCSRLAARQHAELATSGDSPPESGGVACADQEQADVNVTECPVPTDRDDCSDGEEALRRAEDYLKCQRFPEGMRLCFKAMSGSKRASQMMRFMCDSWEDRERTANKGHADEVRRLTAQLASAKELSTALRERKEKHDMEFAAERRRREAAESDCFSLRRQLNAHGRLVDENSRLRQRLAEVEQSLRASEAEGRRRGCRQSVVGQIAELECGPLRQCTVEMRQTLKKKLLVKWHPDKQPSRDHAALATQVMQELQNRPEWHL